MTQTLLNKDPHEMAQKGLMGNEPMWGMPIQLFYYNDEGERRSVQHTALGKRLLHEYDDPDQFISGLGWRDLEAGQEFSQTFLLNDYFDLTSINGPLLLKGKLDYSKPPGLQHKVRYFRFTLLIDELR